MATYMFNLRKNAKSLGNNIAEGQRGAPLMPAPHNQTASQRVQKKVEVKKAQNTAKGMIANRSTKDAIRKAIMQQPAKRQSIDSNQFKKKKNVQQKRADRVR